MTDIVPESGAESELVDLTGVSLRRLWAMDDAAVCVAIRRVLRGVATEPQVLIAAEQDQRPW